MAGSVNKVILIGNLGQDPEVRSVVASLRAAGWRATTLVRGDRLDVRWRELVTSGRTTRAGVSSGTGVR